MEGIRGIGAIAATTEYGTQGHPPREAPHPATGETAIISLGADVTSRLEELQHDDPVRFGQVMTTAAGQLRDASAAGGDDAQEMAALAETLAASARTGELPVFLPGGAPGSHHLHRHYEPPAPHQGAVETALSFLRGDIERPVGTAKDD